MCHKTLPPILDNCTSYPDRSPGDGDESGSVGEIEGGQEKEGVVWGGDAERGGGKAHPYLPISRGCCSIKAYFTSS